MQPIGGLSLVIHFAIIIAARMKRGLDKFLGFSKKISLPGQMPILIVVCVFILVSFGATAVLMSGMDKTSGTSGSSFPAGAYSLAGQFFLKENSSQHGSSDLPVPCVPFEVMPSQRNVILRLDDVQAFAWKDVSARMIDDSVNRRIPIVLGVIPFNIGQDTIISGKLNKNLCNIEIAMHGWSDNSSVHSPLTLGSLNETELQKGLLEGKARLEYTFPVTVRTFIPPNNVDNDIVLDAVSGAGFTVVSSEGNSTYDYSISGFDPLENNSTSINMVINSCENVFSKNKPCVIMLHPQDYTTNNKLDEKKYSSYLNILNELQKRNVTFIRFSDLDVSLPQ